MGEGVRFGTGNGKPLNSMIVERYSPEDIPANCFVAEYEGVNDVEKISEGTIYGLLGFKINDLYMASIESKPGSTSIYYLKVRSTNTKEVVSEVTLDSTLFPYATMHNYRYAIIHLRSIQTILLIPTVTNNRKLQSRPLALYTYNADTGIITTISSSTTFSVDANSRTFVSGDYSSNTFYALSWRKSNVYAIEKYAVNNNEIALVETHEHTTDINADFYDNPGFYIEDIDRITCLTVSSSTTYNFVYDTKNNVFIRASKSSTVFVSSLNGNGGFRGKVALDYSDSDRVFLATNSHMKSLNCYRISTDALEKISLTSNLNDSKATALNCRAIMTVPEFPDLIYGLAYSTATTGYYGGHFTIDLIANKSTASYTNYHENLEAFPIYITASKIIFITSYDNGGSPYPLGVFEFILRHIELATSYPIFGITKKSVKAGKSTEVYTLADNIEMTLYGIPSALTTTIKDDTIQEVQDEINS